LSTERTFDRTRSCPQLLAWVWYAHTLQTWLTLAFDVTEKVPVTRVIKVTYTMMDMERIHQRNEGDTGLVPDMVVLLW
jgi:hypothetical protein